MSSTRPSEKPTDTRGFWDKLFNRKPASPQKLTTTTDVNNSATINSATVTTPETSTAKTTAALVATNTTQDLAKTPTPFRQNAQAEIPSLPFPPPTDTADPDADNNTRGSAHRDMDDFIARTWYYYDAKKLAHENKIEELKQYEIALRRTCSVGEVEGLKMEQTALEKFKQFFLDLLAYIVQPEVFYVELLGNYKPFIDKLMKEVSQREATLKAFKEATTELDPIPNPEKVRANVALCIGLRDMYSTLHNMEGYITRGIDICVGSFKLGQRIHNSTNEALIKWLLGVDFKYPEYVDETFLKLYRDNLELKIQAPLQTIANYLTQTIGDLTHAEDLVKGVNADEAYRYFLQLKRVEKPIIDKPESHDQQGNAVSTPVEVMLTDTAAPSIGMRV